MGVEYELKFRAVPDQQEMLRKEVTGEEKEFDMATTYYDACDDGLSRRFYTLRRRMENDRSVCTLKAPIDEYGRGEWEVDCDDIHLAIEKLCKLGAPSDLQVLTAKGIKEVCGARFHRIAKTVTLPQGTVELAIDRGVLTGGGKEIDLCEVEVELKEGTPEMTQAYALLLAARYGLEPEKKSKFRRALALAKGE